MTAKGQFRAEAEWVQKIDMSGRSCWPWRGGRQSGRYGKLKRNGKWWMAHRAAYDYFKGPIPDGLTIDHLCKNIICCNPAHLEAVTLRENLRRGNSPSAQNARKTHCLRGHELVGDNVYRTKKNQRYCKMCIAIRIESV